MIVVDTHIIIWEALAPQKLSVAATQAWAQAAGQGEIFVSDISLWEIAMLMHKERLQVNTDCQSFINLLIQANNLHIQPITPQIAALSVQLTNEINQDPADRLIAATALSQKMPLITADRNLQAAVTIHTIW
ncbi:MAG TPA: type II toxin-antitoxin system VapC family toxin [Chloroflexi bacterium]|nr:type II toxin-antitoxin system VapC family toxin [Chloroflexota bacterium]